MTSRKRLALYAAFIPLSWVAIATLGFILSFVLPLPSSTSTSIFFFPQYSHSFYAAYRVMNGHTIYLFPISHSWVIGLIGWLALAFGFSYLMRGQRLGLAMLTAPAITFIFMVLARYLILGFGYQIPLVGL